MRQTSFVWPCESAQSKECRCEGSCETSGLDGEREKEAKNMEGEVGADGRWQISEESVHSEIACREKTERKIKKNGYVDSF